MSIGDDIADALPELRAQAESRMRDTATVYRPSAESPSSDSVVDDPTYEDLPVYGPDVDPHGGRCRISPPTVAARTAESADSTVTVQGLEFHTPDDAPTFRPGDLVVMAVDTRTPRLRGRQFRVESSHAGSDTTAQRVPITDLPGVVTA